MTTHRRQGLAGRLVLATLKASRERGEAMSVLAMPVGTLRAVVLGGYSLRQLARGGMGG